MSLGRLVYMLFPTPPMYSSPTQHTQRKCTRLPTHITITFIQRISSLKSIWGCISVFTIRQKSLMMELYLYYVIHVNWSFIRCDPLVLYDELNMCGSLFNQFPCWWRLIPMNLWCAEQKEKQACHKTAYNYATSKSPLSNFKEENMRISICEDEGDGNPSTIYRHVSCYRLRYDAHRWCLREGLWSDRDLGMEKRGGELKWLGSWTQYNMSLRLALKSRLTKQNSYLNSWIEYKIMSL